MADGALEKFLKDESTFIQKLGAFIEEFARPLMEENSALVIADLRGAMLMNMEALYAEHQKCMEIVREAQAQSNQMSVASALKEMMTRCAPLHKAYASNYVEALRAFERADKSTSFNAWLMTKNVDIRSLMLEPAARIPQYQIHLQELLRHTPSYE